MKFFTNIILPSSFYFSIRIISFLAFSFLLSLKVGAENKNLSQQSTRDRTNEDSLKSANASTEPAKETLRYTKQGFVEGFQSDLNTLSWHGIPYAKPPIDELRWKAPKLPLVRNNILKATNNSTMCPQIAGPLTTLNPLKWNSIIGREDCLHLNIVAPNNLVDGEELPVMLWIHGGGNSIGSKGNSAYTGEHLVSKGRVVLVSVNYRLGPLGWFTHPALLKTSDNELDRSGNYGTLDLIAALQWTKDNIKNFGGNPNNVTIFGESAGGSNVYSLLISPKAKSLFHRAISQSGNLQLNRRHFASAALTEGGYISSSTEIISKVLQSENSKLNTQQVLQLQRTMNPEELSAKLRNLSPKSLILQYPVRAAGMLDFRDMITDGSVLPKESLAKLLADPKKINAVPMILGTNRDESKTFMALDSKYVGLGFQIKDKAIYNRTASFLSRHWKLKNVDDPARVLSQSKNGIYAYRFDWDKLPNLGFVDIAILIGAGHGLEIPFVFGGLKSDFNLHLLFGFDGKEERQTLSDSMISYWTQFAYTGSPARGRYNELPLWTAWNNNKQANKSMLLDSEENGIKMSKEEVHKDQLIQLLENDTVISDTKARCELYRYMFVPKDLIHFDRNEYLNFGKKTESNGCEDFPL